MPAPNSHFLTRRGVVWIAAFRVEREVNAAKPTVNPLEMNVKSTRTLGLLLASAALAAGAFAQTPTAQDSATTSAAGSTQAPHGRGRGRLYAELGLTAEQQDSVKAIMTAARPQMKTLHEQMKSNRTKLRQTTPDDPNYANVVAEVAQSNATLASQRTTQGAQVQAQIYALLTPTQKTQLASLQAQWAANPHHGRWGGGRAAGVAAPAGA